MYVCMYIYIYIYIYIYVYTHYNAIRNESILFRTTSSNESAFLKEFEAQLPAAPSARRLGISLHNKTIAYTI